MALSDLLSPASILVPLLAADREAAIAALVAALALPDDGSAELKKAILAREAVGSTGMGNGIAIPHARTARLKTPRLAIGRAERPIDFKSADGKPVSLIFLLAVPEASPQSHLRALAALSRMSADKKILRGLMKSTSSQELFSLVADLPV